MTAVTTALVCVLLMLLNAPASAGEQVDLNVYRDRPLSTCEAGVPCSRLARWQCFAAACNVGGSQRPSDCFAQFGGDKAAADAAICLAANAPTPENVQAAVSALPGAKMDDVVHGLMMMRALQGDAAGCRQGIQEYAAASGASVTGFWAGAMSGCRILSGERSCQEEERDYKTWARTASGERTCADIQSEDIQALCASGAEPFFILP